MLAQTLSRLQRPSHYRINSIRSASNKSIMHQNKKLAAVCQLNSINDKDENFRKAKKIIVEAAAVGANMIFLPECFDFIGTNKQEVIDAAEPLDGLTVSRYSRLAKELKVWLSLGGFHQKSPESGQEKILNAHIIINDEGKIDSLYHKIHLFNLEIPNVVRLIESESYLAGKRLPEPVNTPLGKVGLGICYDLRFGEMAIAYARAGADILTYPSSFTVPTGIHHWEPLIRARAIENQCYVIAAAQVGTHNPKRASFGHAMIVDPWGTKIAECSDGTGFALGLIDTEFLITCRQRLPIWTDRRYDIYAEIKPADDDRLQQKMDTLHFPQAVFGEFTDVYPPAEDTFLLIDALESDLDMLRKQAYICVECGSGSGAVITSLSKAIGSSNRLMIAIDINREACLMTGKCKQFNLQDHIEIIQGHLTSPFDGRLDNQVDLLVFNPPYVPTDTKELKTEQSSQLDLSWAGGHGGRAVIDRFLNEVPRLLSKPYGVAYLVALDRNDINNLQGFLLNDWGIKGEVVKHRRAGSELLFVIKYSWLK